MLARPLLAALAALAFTGFAQASDMVVSAPPTAPSECDNSSALGNIKHRFAEAERSTWHRGYVMDALQYPRPSGHPYAEPGRINRTYCMADAVMTNGEVRTVYYAIEHGLGFVGLGWGVDFCVLGLDPWHVYDGACRTVR